MRRKTLRELRLHQEAMDEDARRREEAVCRGCNIGDDGRWKIHVRKHQGPDGFYHEECKPER
ncbi:MAG: hypothetical protein ACXABY_01250 [Candidatus Thorarchaeota archaeon]